jgi:hypothetical protein
MLVVSKGSSTNFKLAVWLGRRTQLSRFSNIMLANL